MARCCSTLIVISMLALPARFLIADGELPPQGHVAKLNDMEMYYEIHGKADGDPLVLLHGFLASGTMWQRFLDDLGPHFKVIVPDLRGHGRSTNPSKKFTHRQEKTNKSKETFVYTPYGVSYLSWWLLRASRFIWLVRDLRGITSRVV